MERRLAAILAADMVGYSKLMAADEAGTIDRQKAHRIALIDPKIAEYGGRIVKTTGDGVLVEFPSVVDAVRCAVEIQRAMPDRESGVSPDRRIRYRIGINLGDIVIDGDDILGDGVNIAARLEALAEPGGICVSRPVHTQVEGKVDLSFEDLGEQKVKNIPKPVRVFRVLVEASNVDSSSVASFSAKRFLTWPVVAGGVVVLIVVAGVALWQRPLEPREESALAGSAALSLPDKPSIAVLPFANLSQDPDQEYLSDGITNDIITDLSRFSGLFVIASNSTFQYKGKPVKIQDVAKDLGVKYVLEGSLQWAGDRVRINAQLIDALTGHHLWANRYDRAADQYFAIQDEIIREIVANLALRVSETERERAFRKGTENLTAYDYYLQAIAKIGSGGKENNTAAIRLLEKALKIDPDYAQAMGRLAQAHLYRVSLGWAESKEESRRISLEMALKAYELAPDDYRSYVVLGDIYLYDRQFDKATAAIDRAIELNPNDPDVLAETAQVLVYLGRPMEAAVQIENAMRLSPFYPQWYLGLLGWALYDAGQYEEALGAMKKIDKPQSWVHRQMAATYVRLGEIEKAREQIEVNLKLDPEYRISNANDWPYKDQSAWDRYAEDLRTAGAPE
jgi:adenylate cyclase